MKHLALASLLLSMVGCNCSTEQPAASGEKKTGTPVQVAQGPDANKTAGAGPAAAPVPAVKVHEVKLNGHTFTLPEGFDIELVAGPPQVKYPIVASFDEQGRLYVAEATESMEKADMPKKETFRIVRLEDMKGNGKFDKATTFADKLRFTEGALWFRGSLYVAAPPSILKLTDTKDAGVADQQVEWYQGKTRGGCANDLHGPYLGPDGWIYWCKGGWEKQTHERSGKPPFVTRAAHIFRCRPDGTGVEPVMTGGMDNPVAVTFTPGGERIFDATYLQFPGDGRRDGLAHAIYGGVYGKDKLDVLEEHKWTGPTLMPLLTHLSPAAPGGLIRYESHAFGEAYRDNLFTALFNLNKVTRHILTPDGATFKTKDEDFLVSSNRDFHPTDVIEDADGSLLVIDTGGWYKICCPSSQLVKPEILGAIYRVRLKPFMRKTDPRGLELQWSKMTPAELAPLLHDGRPAVRKRAIEALAAKRQEAVPVLAAVLKDWKPESIRRSEELLLLDARCSAVWAATRIDHATARAVVRTALAHRDETVRQTAIHSVSIWRDREALPALLKLLKSQSAHNQRAAAEALGRIGDKSVVPALLEALGTPADRALEHSLIYALIEIADREGTAAGLKSKNILTKRAALIALDQMDGGGLKVKAVIGELDSSNPAMKDAAWWVVSHHPEWGGALKDVLHERLGRKNLSVADRTQLVEQLARFARTPAIQKFLADGVGDESASVESRQIVLRAMAQAKLNEPPDAWIAGLTKVLGETDRELLPEAVASARAQRLPKQVNKSFVEALLKLGNDPKLETTIRLDALASVPGGLPRVERKLFDLLISMLPTDQPVAARNRAANVLAHARLSPEQLIDLTKSLEKTGSTELNRLLEAFAQSKDSMVGERLLEVLGNQQIKSGLHEDLVKRTFKDYPLPIQKKADELCKDLNPDREQQKKRLEELLPLMKDGNAQRGHVIFNSQKAACFSCHTVGALGGKVGPDLSKVGQIREERDLLESVIFPSASFVMGYEPWIVATKDGKVYNGVKRVDDPDFIELVIDATQVVRILRNDIEAIQLGKVSIMPAGIDGLLTPQELADLVAFLKVCGKGPRPGTTDR